MTDQATPAKVRLTDGLGAHEGLASNMRSPGGRPRFTVQDGGRWIDDDDFLYDATLKVSGMPASAPRLRHPLPRQWRVTRGLGLVPKREQLGEQRHGHGSKSAGATRSR
jgi:hypothetical protein